MAWVESIGGGLHAWDGHGRRVRYDASLFAPPPLPPAAVHYGGAEGEAAHELLDTAAFESRCGCSLSASLIVATPELQRCLPLENLHADDLPPPLVAPPARLDELRAAIRSGFSRADEVFVAPDAWGGLGLFASRGLPQGALVGEYVGTLSRETGVGDVAERDTYIMRYPDVAGSVHLSAKDAGSLMRFVNHAPCGDAKNNCTCWAVLVDGAYHTCVVTTRAVRRGEELAYDYGAEYWARRGQEPG